MYKYAFANWKAMASLCTISSIMAMSYKFSITIGKANASSHAITSMMAMAHGDAVTFQLAKAYLQGRLRQHMMAMVSSYAFLLMASIDAIYQAIFEVNNILYVITQSI